MENIDYSTATDKALAVKYFLATWQNCEVIAAVFPKQKRIFNL